MNSLIFFTPFSLLYARENPQTLSWTLRWRYVPKVWIDSQHLLLPIEWSIFPRRSVSHVKNKRPILYIMRDKGCLTVPVIRLSNLKIRQMRLSRNPSNPGCWSRTPSKTTCQASRRTTSSTRNRRKGRKIRLTRNWRKEGQIRLKRTRWKAGYRSRTPSKAGCQASCWTTTSTRSWRRKNPTQNGTRTRQMTHC